MKLQSELERQIEELGAELDATGRPVFWAHKLRHTSNPFEESRRLREEWDEQNPEKAAKFREVANQLEAVRTQLRQEQEAAFKANQLRSTLQACGIGSRCIEALDGQLKQTIALRAVQKFLEQQSNFLLLMGPPGSGKSLAAFYATKHMAEEGKRVAAIRAVDGARLSLFDSVDVECVRKIKTCRGVLVVDDLGVEQYHDTWRATFEDIVDARYQDQLPTVLTTNLDLNGFKARYGERIFDRIRHDGQVCNCLDASMRKKETP